MRSPPSPASTRVSWYRAGMAPMRASTSAVVGIGRSGALSLPPPLMRHGFRPIRSSPTTVLRMALSSR